MDKPKSEILIYYDYPECTAWIEEQYGIDVRDYAGRFHGDHDESKPYLDFWHWLCDHEDIQNGGYVTFSYEVLAWLKDNGDIPGWAEEIYTHYLAEFADIHGEVEFCTWW